VNILVKALFLEIIREDPSHPAPQTDLLSYGYGASDVLNLSFKHMIWIYCNVVASENIAQKAI